ncbi:MAG: hypothetical protein K6F33_09385 [Bacteroidales bacterium]|nr:hypothetical protein [Bacteroidales bacterium]
MKKVILTAALLAVLASGAANAQEVEESPLTFSAGLRSREVWRGTNLCGLAGEGGIDFSAGGFSAGVVTTFSIGKDDYMEFDWYASYSVKGAFVSLTDYSWTQDQFEYFGPYKNYHYLELGVGYDFAETTDLPLSVSYNMMLAGANKTVDGDQAHASYIELCYAPSLACGIDLACKVAAAIENDETEALMYTRKDGLNFSLISLELSKTYNLKDFCTVTPAVSAICNPTGLGEHGEMYFAAGLTFGF